MSSHGVRSTSNRAASPSRSRSRSKSHSHTLLSAEPTQVIPPRTHSRSSSRSNSPSRSVMAQVPIPLRRDGSRSSSRSHSRSRSQSPVREQKEEPLQSPYFTERYPILRDALDAACHARNKKNFDTVERILIEVGAGTEIAELQSKMKFGWFSNAKRNRVSNDAYRTHICQLAHRYLKRMKPEGVTAAMAEAKHQYNSLGIADIYSMAKKAHGGYTFGKSLGLL